MYKHILSSQRNVNKLKWTLLTALVSTCPLCNSDLTPHYFRGNIYNYIILVLLADICNSDLTPHYSRGNIYNYIILVLLADICNSDLTPHYSRGNIYNYIILVLLADIYLHDTKNCCKNRFLKYINK